jgi:hypothetical protein
MGTPDWGSVTTTAAAAEGSQAATSSPTARPQASWRILGAGAGIGGGEGVAAYLHPGLGEVLAGADVIAPIAIAGVLLCAILFGSEQTCERVFRLLRWIANRSEPPAPVHGRPGTRR